MKARTNEFSNSNTIEKIPPKWDTKLPMLFFDDISKGNLGNTGGSGIFICEMLDDPTN
jgi:hypothetical protein